MIALQVQQQFSINESPSTIDVNNIVIWHELYLLLNRPKIQPAQYPLFVAGVIDEYDTLKYSMF